MNPEASLKGRDSSRNVQQDTKSYFLLTSHTLVGSLPASGGVCSALGGPGRGRSVCEHGGHSGGGVGLGDGDLLGLAGLLSTVGTEALTFKHRGTSTMETVRDADVWLALHEGPLHNEMQNVSVSKNIMLLPPTTLL